MAKTKSKTKVKPRKPTKAQINACTFAVLCSATIPATPKVTTFCTTVTLYSGGGVGLYCIQVWAKGGRLSRWYNYNTRQAAKNAYARFVLAAIG